MMTASEKGHARRSPSGSKRWIACPGQPALSVGLSDESSSAAVRGTMAHHVLEMCLNNGFRPHEFVGNESRQTKDFTVDDADAVEIALDWMLGEIEEKLGDEVDVEAQLRYSDDFWGTADFVRYRSSDRELLIADYKHGSGVMVDAIDNPQGVSYALMKLKALGNRGVSRVRFVIIQPRGFHEDGPIREFVVDGVDMLDWEDILAAALEKSRQADADQAVMPPDAWAATYLATGSHCHWCPAAAVCPALKADALAGLMSDFDPVAAAVPGTSYDVAALETSWGLIERMKAWITAVDSFAYTEAERGVKFATMKLVAKRPFGRWRDPAEVIAAMDFQGLSTNETHEPAELKSPAQLRVVLEPAMPGKTKKARTEAAKVALDALTDFTSSGHTLVRIDDPRAPIRQDARDDFSVVAD